MLKLLYKTIFRTVILFICLSITVIKVSGQITIAKWKGNKEAALSIGSDDAMVRSIKSTWVLENPDVPYDGYYKLGQNYQVGITFFIDAKQIDDTTFAPFSSYIPITQPPASSGSWADWKFMSDAGHEIASHTYSHANFKTGEIPSVSKVINEIVQNNTRIANNIGEIPISFNMPFTEAYSNVWPIARDYYPIVANDVWKESGHLYFDITKDTKQGELEAMLETSLKNGNWMTAVGHGIRTELGCIEEASPNFIAQGIRWDGFSPVEYHVLDAFFRFAHSKKDNLFIGTFKDVGQYKMERENSRIIVVSETKSKLIIDVIHKLEPAHTFVYPLTLKIPANQYNIANVVQGGIYLPFILDERFFLIDVIPNGGEIEFTLDGKHTL